MALASLQVVDLTEALAGPYCTMLLGDLGAEAIKLERPGVGDQARAWGARRASGWERATRGGNHGATLPCGYLCCRGL